MSERPTPSRFTRRDLLRFGGVGALVLVGGGAIPAFARGSRPTAAGAWSPSALLAADPVDIHLAATDGHILLPGRGSPSGPGGNPLYIFGFTRVPVGAPVNALDVVKGISQFPTPILSVPQEADVYLSMTNIGFAVRPDLDDSHTIHWHGFPNAAAIFDGVPEVSISVPTGSTFPYYYKPHRAGTFMYHCHFEDVEHVQMGMQGQVFVRPAQDGSPIGGHTRFAYNDGDGSTGFDREFVVHLQEIWTTPHDNSEMIQETVWPNYDANYWVINGRAYPDTVAPNNDPDLPAQPLSARIQVNGLETVLLRFSNLGYEQQSMQLPGIQLKVVGEDATLLRGMGGADLSYFTNTIYIGPGEARDVLFQAPAFDDTLPFETDIYGRYNVYWLKNRNLHRLTNDGQSGLGGQVTQVWIYEGTSLADQTHPNQTYDDVPGAPGTTEHAPTPPYLDPWIV